VPAAAPAVTWMVASMARVPLADASCQFHRQRVQPAGLGRGQTPAQPPAAA
jgi:hypothetical protein